MDPVAVKGAVHPAASVAAPRAFSVVPNAHAVRRSGIATAIVVAVACVATIVGAYARFTSLDRKLVFQDEAYSFVRVAGYELPDIERLFDGRMHEAREFADLQKVTPKRPFGATVQSLAEEPGRAPLYYLVARLWIDVFGDGLAKARALSALLGVAGIGIAFLIGRRLSGTNVGGWIAAAFTAVSPMLVRFSQQLREYVFVADLAMLSTWLLIRACDRNTRGRWVLYGLVAAAGIFTSVTFAAAILAQGCAVAFLALRRKDVRALVNFTIVSVAAVAAYVPWLLYAMPRSAQGGDTLAFASEPYSLGALGVKWAFNLGSLFFDAEFAKHSLGYVIVPILAIVAAAVWQVVPPKPRYRWQVFALALAASTIVPLVAIDIARGSHLEGVVRYSMSSWAGILLLVAMIVAAGVASRQRSLQVAGVSAFVFLVACGAWSDFADRRYDIWWDNNEHLSEQAVAAEIGRRGPAVLLATASAGSDHNVLVLSRYLRPDAKLLVGNVRLAALPAGIKRAYLLLPTLAQRHDLIAALPVGARLENISPGIGLTLPDLRTYDPDGGRFSAANALWQLSIP